MATLRKLRNEEDYDYDKIIYKHRKRVTRKSHSGKNHLLENLKAKQGMRLLKTFGPLMKFSNRDTVPKVRKGDDLFEWKKFVSKSQRHSVKLAEKQPDIVKRINEKNREEKERDRQKKEDTQNGEWH